MFSLLGCSDQFFHKQININVKNLDDRKSTISEEFSKDVSMYDIDRLIIWDPNEIDKYDIVIYLVNFSGVKEVNSFLPVAKSIASDSEDTLGFVFLDDHDDEKKYQIIAKIFKFPSDTKKSYILAQKKNESVSIIIQVTDFNQAAYELNYILKNHKEKWENLLTAMQLKGSRNAFLNSNLNLNEEFKNQFKLIYMDSL